VVHPSNALYFYIILFGVANFTPVDISESTTRAFDFTPSEEANTLNFKLLGYESMNAIENLGNCFLFLLGGVAMALFAHVFRWVCSCCKC